jgi:hypothetical protein
MAKKTISELEIIPTEHMVKDLGVLLNLKATQISSFADVVNSKEGFGIAKETNLAHLVRAISVTGDEFEQILGITKYLYDRLAEKEGRFEDLFSSIQDIAREHDLPSPTRKEKAFRKLFTVPAIYRKKRKFEPYRQGIVHKISAIAYTHEVRAAFDDDSDGEIQLVGYIPIAYIRLVAEDDKEDKQTLLFTADYDNLEKLIKRLTKVKDKLEIVKKDLSGKGVELQ